MTAPSTLDSRFPLRSVSEHHTAAQASEAAFYGRYGWCLNAFQSVAEAAGHLRSELTRLSEPSAGWQREEIRLNVFLLACIVSDAADDYLLGPRYDFSRASNVFAPVRTVAVQLDRAARAAARVRGWRTSGLFSWRDRWEEAVMPFAAPSAADSDSSETAAGILTLLERRLPEKLLRTRPNIPAAFRSQDLAHQDAYALGRKFTQDFPDRNRPVLVTGLRTAGSYLAPLLCAYLRSEGYHDVEIITLRPKTGVGARESLRMKSAVRRGALAAIIDEPVYSGSTIALAAECLKNAGFGSLDLVALFPVHPHGRQWHSGAAGRVSSMRVVTLEPEEWHKASLLELPAIRRRLAEYFGTDAIGVRPAGIATAELQAGQEPGFHDRLKRVYEVEVPGSSPRLILAKSTGWGWLGYHAFLAGTRLEPRVPRVLGLRDGIILTEWVEKTGEPHGLPRERIVQSVSSYVAARARNLALESDPMPALAREGRHRGVEELAAVLSGAYNSKVAAVLKRPRIQHELSRLACRRPTLIDGKMRPAEWLNSDQGLLKADFEHHGMGKHQLNVTDPAYDLAEAILHWSLSPDEEGELIDAYVRHSGDDSVAGRLFLHKLLAGTWAMARSCDGLKDPGQIERHWLFNERYLAALNFLTIHTTRFCASLARRPSEPRWRSPLAVLDVDGVLDKQIFGFPSSTAAGIEAISVLASHGYAIALNTARPAPEMKEYCRAWGLTGGAAEYGAYVWDGVNNRERALVSDVSMEQMDRLRRELVRLPGVFLNDSCRYSVRAYTFARGTTVPLPEMQVRTLMSRLGLDRLHLHQTFTDSTVIAAETDKGKGLLALLSLAGGAGFETVAVGDTEPDLAMFRVATRSFAPGHVSCPGPARMLGCRIAERSWQPGLLEIARRIVHPGGGSCAACVRPKPPEGPWDALFERLLRTADRGRPRLLVQSLLDPKAIRAFSR